MTEVDVMTVTEQGQSGDLFDPKVRHKLIDEYCKGLREKQRKLENE